MDAVVASATAHLEWCRGVGRIHWDARRAQARIRLFLDLVSERARAEVMEALDGELGAALRQGTLTPRQAMGRLE